MRSGLEIRARNAILYAEPKTFVSRLRIQRYDSCTRMGILRSIASCLNRYSLHGIDIQAGGIISIGRVGDFKSIQKYFRLPLSSSSNVQSPVRIGQYLRDRPNALLDIVTGCNWSIQNFMLNHRFLVTGRVGIDLDRLRLNLKCFVNFRFMV